MKFSRVLVMLSIAATTVVVGSAGTVSYDSNIPLTTLSLSNVALDFQQFDSSLGTLTKIVLSILPANGIGGRTEIESSGGLLNTTVDGSTDLDISIKATFGFSGFIIPTSF